MDLEQAQNFIDPSAEVTPVNAPTKPSPSSAFSSRRTRSLPLAAVVCTSLGLSLLIAGGQRFGSTPAFGPLFSPFHGFWRNMPTASELNTARKTVLNGADGPIEIWVDERAVPHVFARSDRDLSFGQGYATARDRLWQMDFQVRSAAGRLSEVLGPKLLDHDTSKRKRGMVWAAERMLQEIQKTTSSRASLEAYAAGVNAYASTLTPATWPLEYKLLGAQPDTWTPLHSAIFAKEMAHDLTGGSDDVRMTNSRRTLGDEAMRALFPYAEGATEPIISKDHVWFLPSQSPLASTPPFNQMPVPSAPLDVAALGRNPNPHPNNGSNNWAVSGSKTASGFPLLADDPHLSLRLPSTWYEVHLQSPNVNVYGASLPGLPSVVVGFNDAVAWGVTNGGNDVLDWYKITFRDSTRKEYAFEGGWRPTQFREEVIRVKGQSDVVLSVPYTHHGPVALEVPLDDGKGNTEVWPLAMRWTAHDPSDEFLAFSQLNKAKSAEDIGNALALYSVPVQNFAFITKTGTIGMHHAGRIPLKWSGQGLYVLDGAQAAHDWAGFIPAAEHPREENPTRGFVSSANQHPVDASYPYALSGVWNATSQARAWRLNELLDNGSALTHEDMLALQDDDLDVVARRVVPKLLVWLDRSNLPAGSQSLLADLEKWDFRHTTQNTVGVFYEKWLTTLQAHTWEGHLNPNSTLFPHLDVFVNTLFEEPEARWFDSPATAAKETRRTRVSLAFQESWLALSSQYGPYGPSWRWGTVRRTEVKHMASLPGFGVAGLETSGTKNTLNAMQKTHGPSWRMVATFDANGPRAWGIYPGGPSGNAASPSYAPMVETWLAAKADELLFPADSKAAEALASAPTKHALKTLVPDGASILSLWRPAWSDVLAQRSWWLVPVLASLVGFVLPGGLFVAALSSGALATLGWGLPVVAELSGAHGALLARMGALLGVASPSAAAALPFAIAFFLAALPSALLGFSFGVLRVWIQGTHSSKTSASTESE